MIQWCDAPFTINIPELDLTSVSDIHVTLYQGPYSVTIKNAEVIGQHDLKCLFTQKQTAIFSANEPVSGIINFLNKTDGLRDATQPFQISVQFNPYKKEIVKEDVENE